MEKDKFLEAINNHLEDIREQFDIIREYEGKIPAIELDLILSNLRKVYEAFLQLEKMNQPVIAFSVREEERKIGGEEEKKIGGEEERKIGGEEEKKIGGEEPVEEAQEEPLPPPVAPTEEAPLEVKEEPEQEPVKEQPVVAEKHEEEPPKKAKSTLDLFGESSSTLADSLKSDAEKRIADKLKVEKIKDIKSAIGINEKFLFINELFDGSLSSYEEAIGKLNQCNSGAEAGILLDGYREKYHWADDSATAASFTDLVNRKF